MELVIRALFTCHHNLVLERTKEMEKSFQYTIGINDKFNFSEIDDLIYQDEEKFEDLKILINKKNKKEYYKNINDMKESEISIYLLHFPKFESISNSTGLMSKLSKAKRKTREQLSEALLKNLINK